MEKKDKRQEFFDKIEKVSAQNEQMLTNLIAIGEFNFSDCFSSSASISFSENHLIIAEKHQSETEYYSLELSYHLSFTFSHVGEQKQKEIQNSQIDPVYQFSLEKQSQTIIKFSVLNSSYSTQQIVQMMSFNMKRKGFHEDFKAKRRIGQGSFAKVYLAERLEDEKMFAVKAFKRQNILSLEKNRKMFENEFRILKKLNHHNIVKFQAIYETENTIYVVQQNIEGIHLLDAISYSKRRNINFSEEEISSFLSAFTSILSYLHRKGIAHRDIKPENIMLRNRKLSDPVLIDFGLAADCKKMPYTAFKCGTPGYVAPQIFKSDSTTQISPICDVFSMGVLFYNLLTKKPLFYATGVESSNQNYREIKRKNEKCEYEIQGQINEVALDLLKKMLEKEPSQRITPQQIQVHPYFMNKIASETNFEHK